MKNVRISSGFNVGGLVGTMRNGTILNSNVEGLIVKIKEQVETIRDTEEDEALKKKAKNLLKKIQNIIWGSEKAKIIIEDKTGNSAIISDNAVKEELK